MYTPSSDCTPAIGSTSEAHPSPRGSGLPFCAGPALELGFATAGTRERGEDLDPEHRYWRIKQGGPASRPRGMILKSLLEVGGRTT